MSAPCGAQRTHSPALACGLSAGHPGPHWSTIGGTAIEWRDATAERDALRAKVERVEALHQKAPESDIHGEPICVVCGMRDSYPCATIRALRGES